MTETHWTIIVCVAIVVFGVCRAVDRATERYFEAEQFKIHEQTKQEIFKAQREVAKAIARDLETAQ